MIICIAVFIISIVILIKEFEPYGILEWVICVFVSCLFTLIPIALAIMVGINYDLCTVEKTKSQEIMALKDNMTVKGSFYLFGGQIDGELYYFYAMKEDEGYVTRKVKGSNCFINYTDGTPRIDTYEAKGFKKWTTWFYAIPAHYHYSVYVPEGSLTTDFQIDLE